ncbi:hypothetical protein [Synechococcus sp. CBW1108]|uniref:hypothetical protein n=1 Tax=Synechococcus sp. CBW1108 TaxID=1353147 RepID=UPI001E5F77D0|nr:hypothetical protein [Synechococcus sp. CBW1108]
MVLCAHQRLLVLLQLAMLEQWRDQLPGWLQWLAEHPFWLRNAGIWLIIGLSLLIPLCPPSPRFPWWPLVMCMAAPS